MVEASPFQIVDPGFNAILIRSCSDLADLADALGFAEIAERNRIRAKSGIDGMASLWSDHHDQYLCFDRRDGDIINNASIAGLIAAFAPIPSDRAEKIAARILKLGKQSGYLVPSQPVGSPEFDGKRYWRGPAWLIANFLIANGMERAGQHHVASRIVEDSLRLIDESGFAEYYDPITAEACGGSTFTWTAAMVIEFLAKSKGSK